MEDDVFVELAYAMKAKVEARDKDIEKLNQECTELHQRIIALGRAAEAQIDYWRKGHEGGGKKLAKMAKRLHDKNDSVTKLPERNGILESVLDMKTRHLKDVEEWRAYWKKGYFEVYNELQGTAKALSGANEKLNELSKPCDWRRMYWEAMGQLAARRDECQDFKAKVKRLEKAAVIDAKDFDYWRDACQESNMALRNLTGVVDTLRELREIDQKQAIAAQEGYDCLHEDFVFWKKAHHCVNQELQDLKSHKLVVAGTEDVEVLKKKLKHLEDYHQDYYVKTQEALKVLRSDQRSCYEKIAEFRAKNEELYSAIQAR